MINLEVKRAAHIVPSYSLTGDLLSYLRCSLQYRYYNGSSLPPSRPVQLWYGEFIHGVLESAYRLWESGSPAPEFPWPFTPNNRGQAVPARQTHDIGEIGSRIEEVLLAQGKQARSNHARDAAYRRALVAVNELGPLLFPLIADAEAKVIGTRQVPLKVGGVLSRAERYELHGVIDVVTRVSLSAVASENPLRKAIEAACVNLPPDFEIIADYKGAARPRSSSQYWQQGDWQVQTYAWLRRNESLGTPIIAGVLIYINELSPGQNDFVEIQSQIKSGETDILPIPGSSDEQILRNWRHGQSVTQLSLEFRLRRAIRVIPVTQKSLIYATSAFDNVVRDIEDSIGIEEATGLIPGAWHANCKDVDTCSACDFRHYCPSPAPFNVSVKQTPPLAP